MDILYLLCPHSIAEKFDGELNVVVWQIDQPTAKLEFANIKVFVQYGTAHVCECDRVSRSKFQHSSMMMQ